MVALGEYVGQHGRTPSMRELAHACGFATASGIYRYLSRLKADGRLEWEPNLARTMRTVDVTQESGV